MTNAIKVLLQMTSVSLQPVPSLTPYRLQRHTCHLQQHFFHISEPNKGTKGPENHSLG
jgi:hypothetical protein